MYYLLSANVADKCILQPRYFYHENKCVNDNLGAKRFLTLNLTSPKIIRTHVKVARKCYANGFMTTGSIWSESALITHGQFCTDELKRIRSLADNSAADLSLSDLANKIRVFD